MLPALPPVSTPLANPDGTMNHLWYLYFYNLSHQTIGVTAQVTGAGHVSPGGGQADANMLFASSQALI